MKRMTILFTLAMLATACETRYHSYANSAWREDGYSEVQLDATTYRVRFEGLLTREQLDEYLLYRCAEITESSGFDYFVATDREERLPPQGKLEADETIRMFRGAPPADEANAYDAVSVMSWLEPRIER